VVSFYMTGLGAMTPPIADGEIGPLQAPFPLPVLGVGATVGSSVANVLFVGQAPGLVAGAVQVNVEIPASTPTGNAAVVIYVGNYRSQIALPTVTVR
jgi:uncharacterized protein (TIGR03437 family)